VATNTTETARLLVVSRESAVLRPLLAIAEPNCWQVETAVSAWDAIERVQSGAIPNLLLLDLPRGDNDFLHVLRWMRRLRPDLPVVVTCSAEDAGRKRDATRLGAQEVLIKPFDEARLESAIQRHLVAADDMGAEIASEHIEQLGPDSFFVSASVVSQKLRAQAELLAEADVPVLILGETGSGKHTVARLIHKLSVRSGFQFLKVNCADMPDDLLEAELFGSERTASANNRNGHGKIERAERGTILLDEITEMPLALQARLMEVLQDRVLLSSDGEKAASADVRILASTSANINRALDEGRLREDLYYRLSAFTVRVPPLRQRKSEIVFLLQHSMHQLSKHYGLPRREFSSEMLVACQQYSWPGNLTELERFIKRYLVAGDTEFNFNGQPNLDGATNAGHVGGASNQIDYFPAGKTVDVRQSSATSLKAFIQNVKGEAERNAIGTALQKTGWNRKAASRLLQVSYRTLLYKIDQYHMSATEPYLSSLPASKFSLERTAPRRDKKD
jgi:two-component system response regulator AtoC